MTISSALNAGVAGLFANSSRLAGISDNIANSATNGYKRVETDFQSLVVGSQGANYTAGGVRSSSQRLIDQSGSAVSTSNATDLAVRGRGFLPVAQATEVMAGEQDPQVLLTTTGSFRTDADGYLRTTSGLVLMGWPAQSDGSIPNFPRDTTAGLEPVQINANAFTVQPTTEMRLRLNLPATDAGPTTTGDPLTLAVDYIDNLALPQNLQISFTPTTTPNTWTMSIVDNAQAGVVVGEYTLAFDGTSQTAGGELLSVTQGGGAAGGAYDPATGTMIIQVASGPIELNIGAVGDGDAITQLGEVFAPQPVEQNGRDIGFLDRVEVDENGLVRAFFESGSNRVLYQIPLIDLPNPNGMISMDNQTYAQSPESGSFFLWEAGTGPTGEILGFALEQSTTDVAQELTAMIQTQRAYSSNAKVIQTVDEMWQETTNIKR